MIEITSLTNEIVKDTVKLQQKKNREESGLFLLEGFKPVEEAINAGVELERIFLKDISELKWGWHQLFWIDGMRDNKEY